MNNNYKRLTSIYTRIILCICLNNKCLNEAVIERTEINKHHKMLVVGKHFETRKLIYFWKLEFLD